MSLRLMQAVNQVRYTNVAIVRLKRKGKRFEIACYKNKVVNWRNGVETSIDEVLQTEGVFKNTSKGILASDAELEEAFSTADKDEVCKIILSRGELQISEKERQSHLQSLFRDIANIVADKCVNSETNRPFPVSMIERFMRDIHYNVLPTRSAKQQALEVIRRLQSRFPIRRAQMRIRLIFPHTEREQMRKALQEYKVEIDTEKKTSDIDTSIECRIDPGQFRAMDALLREIAPDQSTLEVIDLAVQKEGESTLEQEITLMELGEEDDVDERALRQYESVVESEKTEDTFDSFGLPLSRRKNEEPDEWSGGGGSRKRRPRKQKKKAKPIIVDEESDESGDNLESESQNVQEHVPVCQVDALEKKEKESARENLKPESNCPSTNENKLSGIHCNSCRAQLSSREEQRSHYRSDWHRFNLKMKLRGVGPVTEVEFNGLSPIIVQEAFALDT